MTHLKFAKTGIQFLKIQLSSPHSSPVPSGQVMPKEVVEAKFDALNSRPPVVAHLVSEQEDLDSLLHYVDEGVVSYLSHYDIMTHSHFDICHHNKKS